MKTLWTDGRRMDDEHQAIRSQDLCLGLRGIFSRKNAFLLYDNYGHARAQEAGPEDRKFTIFVDPSFHNYYTYKLFYLIYA